MKIYNYPVLNNFLDLSSVEDDSGNYANELACLDGFLMASINEDVGTGDITTIACVPETAVSKGIFIAKEPGVISGLGLLSRIFKLLDETVCVTPLVCDGDSVITGEIIAEISGPSRAILTGERTALNLLQHMSGIATKTAEAVREVSGTKTKILDTRKTTPGLRALDKYAVKCGGGTNHRFNLTDGVLIKDNHIKASGGIANAVKKVRESQITSKHKTISDNRISPIYNTISESQISPSHNTNSKSQISPTHYTNSQKLDSYDEMSGKEHHIEAGKKLQIEVETETIEQVKEALAAGADIIMLDNMTPELMTEAVKIINGQALTEASGNMGERDLKAIAETGVDFISIGALTHSIKAMDISLLFLDS